jgi:subtilisin family serine protease
VNITSAKVGGGLTTMSGTSMATPRVAGVAVLWAEKLKSSGNANSALLTAKLLASAESNGLAEGYDPFDVGAGVVMAPQS